MCLTGNSKIQHDDWTFPTTNWIALIDAESFGSLMREKNYTYECIWQVSKMLRNSSIESIIFIRLSCWVFFVRLTFHIRIAYHHIISYSLIRVYANMFEYECVWACTKLNQI